MPALPGEISVLTIKAVQLLPLWDYGGILAQKKLSGKEIGKIFSFYLFA
jgi:hypothetical protein